MEDKDIINLWKTQDARIEQSLVLNKRLLKEIINQKSVSALRSFRAFETRSSIALVIYLLFLGNMLYNGILHYTPGLEYYIFSVAVIFLINIKALIDYIKHIIWASNISYEGSVTAIQGKLAGLQLSLIKHSRMMFLQFPFWVLVFLNSNWFPHKISTGIVVLLLFLIGLLTYASYWFYKNHTVANLDKKWFRQLIEGVGGKSIIRAQAFYKEIESFKEEY